MSDTIITIGRQFGSGGREIGEKLSKKLNIPFYDKDLLKRAAKESGLCEEIFENFDEKPTSSFLYSLVMDPYSLGYTSNGFEMPLNHKVFLAAFDTIKKVANEGPCVIVGRCADYALHDYKNCVNLFIQAPMEERIKRIAAKYNLSDDKAKDMIIKKDKQRASYYNYYSTRKWADIKNYHMSIDSSLLGIDGTVDMILDFVKRI
ncbi:MAG: cytidylate kinase-like family protein [Lachnospiraceae bacterium]|nr:cytidylate kinase-like family protein [Lachnospiraceae bacterium]